MINNNRVDTAEHPKTTGPQFSLGALMAVVLAASILFALLRHLGVDGAIWFAGVLGVFLVAYGLLRRSYNFVGSGSLILSFIVLPDVAFIVMVGLVMFYGFGALIVLWDWLTYHRSK